MKVLRTQSTPIANVSMLLRHFSSHASCGLHKNKAVFLTVRLILQSSIESVRP